MGCGAEALTSTAAAVLLMHLALRPVNNQTDTRLMPTTDVSRTHYLLEVATGPKPKLTCRCSCYTTCPGACCS